MDKESRFVQAIQKHKGVIYKAASLFATTKADRDDLIQDIMFNLWKSFDSFEGRSKISTWMYRVSMNVALKHLKSQGKNITTFPISGDFEVESSFEEDKEESFLSLHKRIKSLNALDRSIILLYLEEKSHEEIATVIGISKSNVGTRIGRIKNRLKREE